MLRRPLRILLAPVLTLALGTAAHAVCPNGIIEPPETCDDGNVLPGDGCSPLCLLEAPNLPPVCVDAVPSVDGLWPPNHKLVPVGIDGVTDPDGDPITITIVDIAQDEPPGASPGDTCPDAEGLGTDVALVRAERDGGGDGRVYHIAFRADDPFGGSCVGTVEVCVRHDNGHGDVCGDQGPAFDSTVGFCPGDDDDDCDFDACVPPPPFVTGSCDGVPLPPRLERRLESTRRLFLRAAAARPRRARFLLHLARLRLTRLDAIVAQRFGGECQIELHDIMEHGLRCAACPVDDHGRDDDDHDRGDDRGRHGHDD